jgi:hypothetical protein
MTGNLVRLDLSRFSRTDIIKIEDIGRKLRLMHRWFRYERREEDSGDGADCYMIFSGDRGPRTYVSYSIWRLYDGGYELRDPQRKQLLASARSIDGVIDALPDDFFYTAR